MSRDTTHRTVRHRSQPRGFESVAELILFWGMLILLALVQLSFGGAFITSWYMVALGATVLTAVYLGGMLLDIMLSKSRHVTVGFVFPRPASYFVSWSWRQLPLLQLVPLPAGLVKLISPNAYAAWQLLTEHGIAPARSWMPLSIDPTRTLADVLKYYPCPIFSLRLLRNPAQHDPSPHICPVYSGHGPVPVLLWYLPDIRTTTECLVVDKHDAQRICDWDLFESKSPCWISRIGHSNICGIGLILSPFILRKATFRNNSYSYYAKMTTAMIFVLPLILLTSLVLTGSRAGMVVTLVSATGHLCDITFAMVLQHRPVDLCYFFSSSWWSFWDMWEWSNHSQGLRPSTKMAQRMRIYQSSIPFARAIPLFRLRTGELQRTVFLCLPYLTTLVRLTFFIHINDWLQLAIELGAVGFLCGMVMLILVLREILRALASQRSFQRHIVLAILFGFVAIALHNLVDFNFHVPANLFTYSAVLGVALRTPRLKERMEYIRFKKNNNKLVHGNLMSFPQKFLPAVFMLLASIALTLPTGRLFKAEQLYPIYENMTVEKVVLPLERLKSSLAVRPQDPNRIRELGKLYLLSCTGTTALDASLSVQAGELFQRALNGSTLQRRKLAILSP